jgi:hypothetical protein
VTKPLRCLGEMLATFVGRALEERFSCSARPAAGKRCILEVGPEELIGRRGAVGRTGVLWLDEAGTNHVAVCFSRFLGLPAPTQTSWVWHCGSPRNLSSSVRCLLATTGTGHIGRYMLLPARRHGLRAYTSLFPFRTLAGPLLLAAIPTAGSPRQYELAYARPTGPWLSFGTLEVTQTTYRGHDLDLSFDPVLNVVPGLETYHWAAQLRRFPYAASRRARGHRNGQPTSP